MEHLTVDTLPLLSGPSCHTESFVVRIDEGRGTVALLSVDTQNRNVKW